MRLDKYPFLRILIPLSCGIMGGYLSCKNQIDIPSFLWASLSLPALSLLLIYEKKKQFSKRWISGLSVYLILFSAGGLLSQKQYQNALYLWPDSPQYYEILLLSSPEEKTRSFAFEAFIRGYYRTDEKKENFQPVKKKILLYLPKSSPTNHLQQGELLYIYSTINAPRNNGNPEEFDYRDFLLRKGISGTTYTEKWHRSGLSFPPRGLLFLARTIRMKLLSIYRKAGIHGEEYGILAALTLGYKESLSEETRLNFSQAGISHVLALSGLHVGFVYILLEFMLGLFFRNKNATAKQVSILLFLWLFAFLTGMLPPVIRATIMCSLAALARIRNGRALSFNTLSAAAFLMLCFRPLWLFDTGFQLSFTAVAGILLWQPQIFKLIRFHNRLLRYVWGIICVSFTAQLAVLPLILYYFASFPSYFLLTNIAALGLVSVIIYTGLSLLPLSLLPPIQLWLGRIVQKELHLLSAMIEKIGQFPGAQITGFHTSLWQAWGLALLIFTGMYYLTTKRRKPQILLLTLAGACLLAGCEIFKTLQRRQYFPSLIFYNNYNCPALHFIRNKDHSFLWTDSTYQGYPLLVKGISSFRNKLGLPAPQLIQHQQENAPSYPEIQLADSSGIIRFQNRTICHIKNHQWAKVTTTTPLHIDYLWISKGYSGSLKGLQSLFHIKEVVIDASIPHAQQEKLERECILLHLPCTRISVHGAYFISLGKDR